MLMKMLIGMIVSALLLTACASGEERARVNAVYDKYDGHCKEHAEKADGSPDVESRYQECMNYFVTTDIHCPYCAVDKGMQN
jgi:hypothetical protein